MQSTLYITHEMIDHLCKSDTQVDIYLKLLIKSNPVVFLLVAEGQLVCTFKSSVWKILVSCYLFYLLNGRLCLCISDVLRNLVSFVQFKKCEKHPWRNVTFSKVARLHYSQKYKKECQLRSFHCNYILIVSRINKSH